jgi:exosortase/archaeosortase family protein
MIDLMFIAGIGLFAASIYTTFFSGHPPSVEAEILLFLSSIIILGVRYTLISFFWEMPPKPAIKPSGKRTIAKRLIYRLTLNDRLVPYFPLIGMALIAFVFLYNRFISAQPSLGNWDYILLVIAVLMMIYYRIPEKYHVERDFAFLFLVSIFILFVIPQVLYPFITGQRETEYSGSLQIHYLVSIPATFLANLMGVPCYAAIGANNGAVIFYSGDAPAGSLLIGLGCSGIYSVTIFFSAFVSYIFSSFNKLNKSLGVILIIGIILAWFANLIRLALTVGAGYWWGSSALIWFHENVGILIFLAWTAVFWFPLLKYFAPEEEAQKPKEEKPLDNDKDALVPVDLDASKDLFEPADPPFKPS